METTGILGGNNYGQRKFMQTCSVRTDISRDELFGVHVFCISKILAVPSWKRIGSFRKQLVNGPVSSMLNMKFES